jgi:hypothetical protein
MSKEFFLSISYIIFFTLLAFLYYFINLRPYIINKELREKYKTRFIMTLFFQLLLDGYLLFLIIYRINNKYLGFISY